MKFNKSLIKRNQKGQSSVFILVALVTIIAFTLATLHLGIYKRQQMRMQLAADAAVSSGVLWEARTYNMVAAMNQGILIALAIVFIAAIVLVALIICTATIYGAAICGPILESVWDPLTELIKYFWEVGITLSQMERWIVKFAWIPVLLGTVLTGKKNHAQAILPFPFVPEIPGGSNHDQNITLTFHTKDGGFESVVEKVFDSLLKDAPGISKKALKAVVSFIDKMLSSMETPDPLVLDDDFRPRMKLGAIAWKDSTDETLGLKAYSQATPFLANVPFGEEDLFDMNWHAQLQPVDFHKDLLGENGNFIMDLAGIN